MAAGSYAGVSGGAGVSDIGRVWMPGGIDRFGSFIARARLSLTYPRAVIH